MSNMQQQKSNTNIFVGGLPTGTDDGRLHTMFRHFGDIVSAKVMVDLKTKQLRSNGFVNFKRPESAAAAVKHYTTDGSAAEPNRGRPYVVYAGINASEAPPPSKTIYVRNLPEAVSPAKLRKVFAVYGNIIEVTIPSDQHAVGFVKFERIEDAAKAVDTAHNTSPFGPNHVLQVRFKALPRHPTNPILNHANSSKNNSAGPPTSGSVPPLVGQPSAPIAYAFCPPPQHHPPSPSVLATSQQSQYYPVDHTVAYPVVPGLPPGAVPVPIPFQRLPGSPSSQTTTPGTPFQPIIGSHMVSASPSVRTFPANDDIYISGFPNEDWLKAVISFYKPAQMEPMAGGMCVRFQNPSEHEKIADQLSTVISPSTGEKLQVAIIED